MTIREAPRPIMTTSPTELEDALIGEVQAREMLGGIGRTLLRKLAHEGLIASCKIQRRRLYSRRAIARYIADRLRANADDWR